MATLLNRVGVATTTAGSGTIVLGSALASGTSIFSCSFQTQITAGASGGQTLAYLILDSNGAWEYGQGTYTSSDNRLTRTLGQSATGSLLSLSGNSQVFLTARASDILNPVNNLSDVANTATALSNLGGVPTTRTLTAAGLVTGGGDLSANRTFTVTAAVQSDQETGTSNTVSVTPGVQKFHPSAAKAWAKFGFAGSASASFNVSSISDNGAGDATVNLTTAFSSANYGVTAVVRPNTGSGQQDWAVVVDKGTAPTSSACRFITIELGVSINDADFVGVAFFGDQ